MPAMDEQQADCMDWWRQCLELSTCPVEPVAYVPSISRCRALGTAQHSKEYPQITRIWNWMYFLRQGEMICGQHPSQLPAPLLKDVGDSMLFSQTQGPVRHSN